MPQRCQEMQAAEEVDTCTTTALYRPSFSTRRRSIFTNHCEHAQHFSQHIHHEVLQAVELLTASAYDHVPEPQVAPPYPGCCTEPLASASHAASTRGEQAGESSQFWTPQQEVAALVLLLLLLLLLAGREWVNQQAMLQSFVQWVVHESCLRCCRGAGQALHCLTCCWILSPTGSHLKAWWSCALDMQAGWER